FGAGTIHRLRPFAAARPQILTPGRLDDSLDPAAGEYDRYLLHVIQLMRHAAGVRPSCRLVPAESATLSRDTPMALSVSLETQGIVKAAVIELSLRTPRNAMEHWTQVTKSLPAGRSDISFPLPPMSAGTYFADVRVLVKGKVADAGSRHVIVTSSCGIASFEAPKELGASETVAGRVVLRGDVPTGARLRISQVDTFGRYTARTELPATADTSFRLPAYEPLTIVQRLVCELVVDGQVVDMARAAFSLRDLHPDRHAFRYVLWGLAHMSSRSYLAVPAYETFREYGFDTNYASNISDVCPAIPLANMRHIPYATRLHPNDGKITADTPPNTRIPCLTSPEYRSYLAALLTKRAKIVRPYSVNEFSMGDECHFRFGKFGDICHSPTCVAAFHTFLEQEYGTIVKLNAEYGASYKSFDDIEPATLDEAREDPALRCLWIDFRRRMDRNWVEIQEFCRTTLQAVVPNARTGYEGTDYDTHATLNAFDLYRINQSFDLNNTYDGAFSPYAVVDFAQPDALLGCGWVGSYADYKKYGHWPSQAYNWYINWRHLFRGANSVWVWYAAMTDRGIGHGSVSAPDFSLFQCFAPNATEVREMKQGLARLFIAAEREHGGTAVLYSIESLHVASFEGAHGHFSNNLRSIIPLLEDTRQPFRIVAPEQIEKGILAKGHFQYLILPFVQALSGAAADRIREFVQQGGTLVADVRPALCDEHGKYREAGALDEVFGVSHTCAPVKLEKRTVKGGPFAGEVPATPVDATLKLAGGQALAQAGDAPALVAHDFGKGTAVLMNFLLCGYNRKQSVLSIEVETYPEEAPAWLAAFARVQEQAGMAPGVTFEPDLPHLRAYRHRLGVCHLVGVLQNPLRARAQAAREQDVPDEELEAFIPPPRSIRVGFGAKAHVYDSREGRYLGFVDSAQTELGPGRAKVFALLPYRVKAVALRCPQRIRAGEVLEVTAEVIPERGKAGQHVLHLDVFGPNGRALSHYAKNVDALDGRAVLRVPLALNNSPGNWRIRVRDAATGVSAEATFKLGSLK
ncbi:MAG: beta-galactosidase trimerization domain-containing protein, partial [Lentisphaeria bacterium]|nr:beta-galactosidase trimerization domain-containing protein [Lentisphaeria bacterium]